MRGNLAEQVQALVREFDSELSTSCDQLRPEKNAFAGQPIEQVHLDHYREWKQVGNRLLFSRIALAQFQANTLSLKILEPERETFEPSSWPSEWSWVREALEDRVRGGRPPSLDRKGIVLEFPVFRSNGGAASEHWLILEINVPFLRQQWLPALVKGHLNPSEAHLNDVRITFNDNSETLLYATADTPPSTGVVDAKFNRAGRTERRAQMPVQSSGRWLLKAWPRPGALEALAARSQRRNIALALCLNFLMLCTGFALIRYATQSRELAERQIQFVATVSHELRTPLTAIRGAGHNLLRGIVKSPEDVESYYRLILRHADHLKEMADQTLALAGAGRAGAGNHGPVDLRALAEQSIREVTDEVASFGCKIELSCDENLPAVNGNPDSLRRVVQNLIVNAAKHGGKGQWIGIHLSKGAFAKGRSAAVSIAVSDRGHGIPSGELERIFEPFFRGAEAVNRQVRGSGLGLSVVRALVKEHGGEVHVSSHLGQGTTFEVRLPALS